MYSDRVDQQSNRHDYSRSSGTPRSKDWEFEHEYVSALGTTRTEVRQRSKSRSREREVRDRLTRDHRDHRDRDYKEKERERDRFKDRSRSRSPHRRDYRERDRARSRSRDRPSRSNNNHHHSHNSHSNNSQQGEPNQHVVVQGLSPSSTDASVLAELEQVGAAVETVRVVRDRGSGLAKGFAFVKFISIEHARRFMETHGTHVNLPSSRVRLEYSRAQSIADDDWICSNCSASNFRRRSSCYTCKIPKKDESLMDFGEVPIQVNDGTKDVGSLPCNLLVILGLDVLTTEESLFDAVQTYCPSVPITQVRIVKDRVTHQSLGFGFIEFNDTALASFFLSTVAMGEKIFVDGRSVTIDFANPNSFIQVYERSEWVTSFYVSAAQATVFLRYWDEAAYATAHPSFMGLLDLGVGVSRTENGTEQRRKGDDEKTNGVKVSIDDELAAFMNEVEGEVEDSGMATDGIVDESAAQPVDPHTAFGGFSERSKIQSYSLDEEERLQINPGRLVLLNDNTEEQTHDSYDDDKKGDSEDQEQQHLVDDFPEELPEEETHVEPIDLSDEALLKRLPSVEEIDKEKSDFTLIACLLCERQFKSAQDLQKHQAKSGLHKTNLQALREIQISDLRANLIKQQDQQTQQRQGYRNRAAERRKMYGQPSRVHLESYSTTATKGSSKSSRRSYGPGQGYGAERAFQADQLPPVAAFPASTTAVIGDDNIGNKMLRAMGWTEGTGLGAKGDGIVAPVAAEGYAKGAGVGSMPLMKK
ncbi:hypothetical protein HK100_011386 [Physocladia obscura]|uniref:RNA-binding protein n=1 Tax=Physocladia obscura TaxID=109957 RepID=A0AAD5TBN0_9FUNG|nr:hypothetical protein HK100_011386 [Physocladia obscura]